MEAAKTSKKQYAYSIPGLMIPKNDMSRVFAQDIEYIADWIQKNADNLPFLFERHIKAFVHQMEMLHEMLGSIYARWLQNDAAKILKVAEVNSTEMCKTLLTSFVTKAHTLAIEIQMAQKIDLTDEHDAQTASANFHQYNELERYDDVINSLIIISGLLKTPDENPDYGKIMDIAVSTDELKDNENAISLFAGIVMKNPQRVNDEIDRLASVYFKKIDSINAPVSKLSDKKNLLIVDDMAETLTALTLMLEEHYNIYALADGNDALELIDSGQQLDAFLLDIDMPAMDGLTLAKHIRDRDEHADTPILFLTGNSSKEAVIKACLYTPKAFIVKPAGKDLILSKLSGSLL